SYLSFPASSRSEAITQRIVWLSTVDLEAGPQSCAVHVMVESLATLAEALSASAATRLLPSVRPLKIGGDSSYHIPGPLLPAQPAALVWLLSKASTTCANLAGVVRD